MLRHKPHYQGAALLSALFLMTLVAIATTAMSTRLQLDIYRTRTSLQANQISLAADLVHFWAMAALSQKKNTFSKALGQGKVKSFPSAYEGLVPGLKIKGGLYDLQARLNLNNIKEKNYFNLLIRLLNRGGGDAQSQRAVALASLQWISPFVPGRGQDELMDYYLHQRPAYNPSHQPMASVSEWRLVMGVSAKLFQALTSQITALPEITPININFASKSLLMALSPGLNETEASEILEARAKTGFIEEKDLPLLINKLHLNSAEITLKSQYYLAVAEIISAEYSLLSYVILKRITEKNGDISVAFISESLNAP